MRNKNQIAQPTTKEPLFPLETASFLLMGPVPKRGPKIQIPDLGMLLKPVFDEMEAAMPNLAQTKEEDSPKHRQEVMMCGLTLSPKFLGKVEMTPEVEESLAPRSERIAQWGYVERWLRPSFDMDEIRHAQDQGGETPSLYKVHPARGCRIAADRLHNLLVRGKILGKREVNREDLVAAQDLVREVYVAAISRETEIQKTLTDLRVMGQRWMEVAARLVDSPWGETKGDEARRRIVPAAKTIITLLVTVLSRTAGSGDDARLPLLVGSTNPESGDIPMSTPVTREVYIK